MFHDISHLYSPLIRLLFHKNPEKFGQVWEQKKSVCLPLAHACKGGIKHCVLLWTLCIGLSDASACLVPPLCFLWPTNSVHRATTVATTVPPFGDQGNPWVVLAMVLPPLCLLCATCCATIAALVAQGRHKGRAAAVTQKQNFLGLGDHWAS